MRYPPQSIVRASFIRLGRDSLATALSSLNRWNQRKDCGKQQKQKWVLGCSVKKAPSNVSWVDVTGTSTAWILILLSPGWSIKALSSSCSCYRDPSNPNQSLKDAHIETPYRVKSQPSQEAEQRHPKNTNLCQKKGISGGKAQTRVTKARPEIRCYKTVRRDSISLSPKAYHKRESQPVLSDR